MSGAALVAPVAGERRTRGPSPPIRNAATLVILDRSAPEPLVLMGRRHAGHVFMPGKFVFPGGRIEPGDRRMPALGALNAHAETALSRRTRRPSAGLGRALALAAIRETFEETGLMLGRHAATASPCPPGTWAAFGDEGVLPDLDALHLVARAITPPRRSRRFDTRFFAVDRETIAGEKAGAIHPEAELVELVWVPLDRATDLDLPRITRVVLGDLRARLNDGLSHDLPIPFYHERHGRPQRELL